MDPINAHLVAIFKTEDPGVLPLATMALDAEGIEYSIHSEGRADTLQWAMSQQPTNRPSVMEILVTSDVAARARDLVVDLERGAPGMSPTDPAAIVESVDPPTVQLDDAVSGIVIGHVTEAQLQDLTSRLEETAPQQYFVDGPTIDMLESAAVDASLIARLRHAVGSGDGLVIRWTVH